VAQPVLIAYNFLTLAPGAPGPAAHTVDDPRHPNEATQPGVHRRGVQGNARSDGRGGAFRHRDRHGGPAVGQPPRAHATTRGPAAAVASARARRDRGQPFASLRTQPAQWRLAGYIRIRPRHAAQRPLGARPGRSGARRRRLQARAAARDRGCRSDHAGPGRPAECSRRGAAAARQRRWRTHFWRRSS
jgi:hypothetical protein